MMNRFLILLFSMMTWDVAIGAESSQSLVTNSDCAEECLNVKEFNSGEAFYLWTTSSVKIA